MTHIYTLYFNHPSHTKFYTLSLHDALPISTENTFYVTGTIAQDSPELVRTHGIKDPAKFARSAFIQALQEAGIVVNVDRKSTRLNSSHRCISYAVFCLKKKKNKIINI